MKSRIMYIEFKGADTQGPARIGRVTFSKTGKTLYYKDQSFRSTKGKGVLSNYYNVQTGENYWISGCCKDGLDRLYGTRGSTAIDDDVREEYWTTIRGLPENASKRFA
ncbi:MAG TPA: hypothetical protein VMV10_29835 [Pirellulales bacterium]|nr:hypothetical protein [Pirellulales bacterium]